MPSGAPDRSDSVDAPASLTVRVLLFSVLREQVGAGEVAVTLPAPATGTALLNHLIARYPQLRDYRSVVRLAVNQGYNALGVSLNDGDEVALITPVSGG